MRKQINDNDPEVINRTAELADGLIQIDREIRTIYYINIDNEIAIAEKYRPAFNILRTAGPDDVVVLVLNTPGGLVSTTMQMYNYLLTTNATTVAEIHTAYSGGSILALACDNVHVAKFGSMMIHSISASSFGKIHELEGHVNFFNHFNEKAFRELYSGFLSAPEIKTILDGKDMWMMEDEILTRLKGWKPIRQRLLEAQNKEVKNSKRKKQ